MYPFSLLPLSLAAHGGRVDGYESQQLIAAGLTLLQRSAPLVRALSGKRAAILLPTSPAFFVALAACEGRGVVLINPLASPFEISYQIADAGVGAVFTTAALGGRLPADVACVHLDEAPRRAHVAANGKIREVDLGSHVGLSLEGDSDVAGSDDEAVIVYTSAMAGRPLGAILSHGNLLANARSVAAMGQHPDDRVLALLPFSHLFGLTVTGSAPLLTGASIVTMPRFNPARAAELIALGEVTEVVGVPVVFRALISALERRGSANGSSGGALRLCICGGSPLPLELQERWFDATGNEMRQGYGLTETGPVCLFNTVDRPNVRGTLGVPLPGVEVELRAPVQWTEAGIPAPTYADEEDAIEGEICVRGENVFRGYVGGGVGGLAVRDGWLHTGDLGRRNADGTFEFAGLLKPMFTRNGFNIYPHEIENAVAAMPGVDGVTVRERPVDGAEPDIAVEVAGNVDADALKRWCAQRLSAYKQPTIISIL